MTVTYVLEKNEIYLGVDAEKFDDILSSIGVCPIGKNSYYISREDFEDYNISIPYNISDTLYELILSDIQNKNIDTVRICKED